MNLIPCNAQCRYQVEGCCTLHKAEAVNSVQKGCVYFVPREKRKKMGCANQSLLQTPRGQCAHR